MLQGQPSRTALSAAAHRAAHQVLEQGRVFSDPLALQILGDDADVIVAEAAAAPARRPMRMFIAARTRAAEQALDHAVAAGLTQLVILGAGLDTYAYRNPHRGHLRVIEVDHPATQAWKQARLASTGITVPPGVSYAPVDFEHEKLADVLATAGLNASRRSFFIWLGVVPYLTAPAIETTLRTIAGLPGGTEVVFDYGDPPATLSAESRALHDTYAAHVESLGETWLTHFEPDTLHATLRAAGFTDIDDLAPADLAARYYPSATHLGRRGGHVIRALTLPGGSL